MPFTIFQRKTISLQFSLILKKKSSTGKSLYRDSILNEDQQMKINLIQNIPAYEKKYMWCVAYFGTNLKHVENTHTKSKTPPWVFFMFLKLYKQYQIAQKNNIYPLSIQEISCSLFPCTLFLSKTNSCQLNTLH